MRTSVKKVLFVLLLLLIVEIGLRIAGHIYYSMRVVKGPPDIQRDTYRILCLGDSNTFGVGADYGKDYPSQLEGILNSHNSKGIFRVYNRGIPGGNSFVLLDDLPANIKFLHPDLIVIQIGANNFSNFIGYDIFRKSNRRFAKVVSSIYKLRIYKLIRIALLNLKNFSSVRAFKENDVIINEIENLYRLGRIYMDRGERISAIDQFQKAIQFNPEDSGPYIGLARIYFAVLKPNNVTPAEYFEKMYFKKVVQTNPELKKFKRYILPPSERAVINYKRISEWVRSDLNRIIELCRTQKIKLIFQNYPYVMTPLLERPKIYFNEVIEKVARTHSIPLVDNAELFDRLLANERKEIYFNGGHPNSKGYRVMAENIYEVLVSNKIIPP